MQCVKPGVKSPQEFFAFQPQKQTKTGSHNEKPGAWEKERGRVARGMSEIKFNVVTASQRSSQIKNRDAASEMFEKKIANQSSSNKNLHATRPCRGSCVSYGLSGLLSPRAMGDIVQQLLLSKKWRHADDAQTLSKSGSPVTSTLQVI